MKVSVLILSLASINPALPSKKKRVLVIKVGYDSYWEGERPAGFLSYSQQRQFFPLATSLTLPDSTEIT
jgi:hypothetical protein